MNNFCCVIEICRCFVTLHFCDYTTWYNFSKAPTYSPITYPIDILQSHKNKYIKYFINIHFIELIICCMITDNNVPFMKQQNIHYNTYNPRILNMESGLVYSPIVHSLFTSQSFSARVVDVHLSQLSSQEWRSMFTLPSPILQSVRARRCDLFRNLYFLNTDYPF